MSNEILTDRQSKDLIRSFWNIFANAVPYRTAGLRDNLVGSVAAMIFTCEYRENFDSRRALNLPIFAGSTYEGYISAFCDNYRCSAELKSVFGSLRARIPNTGLFVRFLTLLLELSEGLTKKQVKYLGRQILDQSINAQRASTGDFPATREVAQLMLKLTESDEIQNSNVFVPYAPYPGIAGLNEKRAAISCCVPNRSAAAIMAVYQLVEDGEPDMIAVDPKHEPNLFPRHRDFARIVAAPPFATRLKSHWSGHTDSETFCIDQVAQNLTGIQGRAAIFVSPSMLFRLAPNHLRLRRNLIETGSIEAVIMLPQRLYTYTTIASAIIVLRQGKVSSREVRVIDASDCNLGDEKRPILDVEKVLHRFHANIDEENTRTITLNELIACDYDLTPVRHLLAKDISVPEGSTLVSLSEIMSSVSMPRVHPHDQGVTFDERNFPDIAAGLEFSFMESQLVRMRPLRNGFILRKINSSCLLVDTWARRGEIRSFWFSHKGRDLFVSSHIQPMKVDTSRVDPRWLAMAINSKDISDQVKLLIAGTGKSSLRVELILHMQIALPNSLDNQTAIVRSAEELQIKAKAKEIGFEKLLDQQQQDFLKDIRLKKHTLSQIARDIRSRVSVIKNEMEKMGSLSAGQSIGRQGVPVIEYLEHISQRCDDMGITLESLTKIHIFSPLEELSLEEALKAIKVSGRGRHFKLETKIHKDSFKDQETGQNLKPVIHIAQKDFTDLCENIFDNAERHGFRDSTTEQIISIDVFLNIPEQMVEVSIKNTGEPLPGGLTTERFVMRGEKGGVTGNTGLGGHHIKALMDHAKGQVEIQNLTDGLFRVETKLSFPFQP